MFVFTFNPLCSIVLCLCFVRNQYFVSSNETHLMEIILLATSIMGNGSSRLWLLQVIIIHIYLYVHILSFSFFVRILCVQIKLRCELILCIVAWRRCHSPLPLSVWLRHWRNGHYGANRNCIPPLRATLANLKFPWDNWNKRIPIFFSLF